MGLNNKFILLLPTHNIWHIKTAKQKPRTGHYRHIPPSIRPFDLDGKSTLFCCVMHTDHVHSLYFASPARLSTYLAVKSSWRFGHNMANQETCYDSISNTVTIIIINCFCSAKGRPRWTLALLWTDLCGTQNFHNITVHDQNICTSCKHLPAASYQHRLACVIIFDSSHT